MKSDAAFMGALVDGHVRSLWVAVEIVRRYPTCWVQCHVDIYPPRSVHNGTWQDRGDILVNGYARIEVKGRPTLDLANFPYSTVFLGETYKLDPKEIHGVVVVGATRYPMWYFPTSEADRWAKCDTVSSVDERMTTSWYAPVEIAKVWMEAIS